MMWSFVAPAKLTRVPTDRQRERASSTAWHDASLQSSRPALSTSLGTHTTFDFTPLLRAAVTRIETSWQDNLLRIRQMKQTGLTEH